MPVRVKICGLRDPVAMDAALTAGASFVGLVLFPPSPRSVTMAEAATLADRARNRASTVVLLVDPTDAELDAVAGQVAPDMIQLHGLETAERVYAIRHRLRRPLIKAIRVETAGDAVAALDYAAAADLVLFDARPPEGADRPGGHGVPFDWHVLNGVRDRVPYMLSGGLTPDNVREAVKQTGASMVDVSSGVEAAPGSKDPALIRRFIAAARSCDERWLRPHAPSGLIA